MLRRLSGLTLSSADSVMLLMLLMLLLVLYNMLFFGSAAAKVAVVGEGPLMLILLILLLSLSLESALPVCCAMSCAARVRLVVLSLGDDGTPSRESRLSREKLESWCREMPTEEEEEKPCGRVAVMMSIRAAAVTVYSPSFIVTLSLRLFASLAPLLSSRLNFALISSSPQVTLSGSDPSSSSSFRPIFRLVFCL